MTTEDNANRVLPVTYFLGVKIIRYRIITDLYSGFESQKWRIWYPFWCPMFGSNTHGTIEEAIKMCEIGKVVLSS